MNLLGAYLLLGALVVAAAGVPTSSPGTTSTDTSREHKLPGIPETVISTKPASIETKTPEKRPPSPKPVINARRPGAPTTGSQVASGRTGPSEPHPRQYQPTIGDLLGVYALPSHGPNAGMGQNGYPQFGQGFHNVRPLPQQFPGFNNPNLSPHFGGQWPYNPPLQNNFENRPMDRYPAPPAAPKLFFSKKKWAALVVLPGQLTELMQRVGVEGFSIILREWLQSLPIQTQPPIDGRLGDVYGCGQGTPLGQRHGQKPGGVEGTTLKGEVTTTTTVESASDEDTVD